MLFDDFDAAISNVEHVVAWNGCKHLDEVGHLPGAMVLALQNGTKLYEYGWNRLCAEESEENLIELDIGDLLLYRGDLIHADADYDAQNIRVHVYLDTPETSWYKGTTNMMRYIRKDGTYVDNKGKISKLFNADGKLKCPIPDCDYPKDGSVTTGTLRRHINRNHPGYRVYRKKMKTDNNLGMGSPHSFQPAKGYSGNPRTSTERLKRSDKIIAKPHDGRGFDSKVNLSGIQDGRNENKKLRRRLKQRHYSTQCIVPSFLEE